MVLLRFLPLLVTLGLLQGCGTMDAISDSVSSYMGGEDNSAPPAPLTEFQPLVEIGTVWSASIGEGTDEQFLRLAPAVAGERVFAADHEGLVTARALATGQTIWEQELDLPVSGGPGLGEGLVLLGSSDGDLVALSQEDGRQQWRVAVPSEVLSAPQASDGVVVVRTADSRVSAYRAANGERIWTYVREVPDLTLRGSSAPVIAGGRVIAGFDNGRLAALDLHSGRLLWEALIGVPRGRTELERMVDIDATPRVVEDTVYIASYHASVAAVDLESGRIRWSREISTDADLGVDEDNVYVAAEDGSVWALDRITGSSVWRQERLQNRRLSGPVPFGDLVAVGDGYGYLHWLRRDDGQFAARTALDETPILTPPLVAGDLLLVYTSGGHLTALRPIAP
ncbi:MAG: outer membrane protein assembly factor BamB [Gammaproteobacteria bacterium]|nr:MAG: outer membrane protein assembly factor BamB [Gammaproteobacteria bacterium]